MAVSEQHLTTLQQQLALHRATLQELWEQRATYEQAVTALKANGVACGSGRLDRTDSPKLDRSTHDSLSQRCF